MVAKDICMLQRVRDIRLRSTPLDHHVSERYTDGLHSSFGDSILIVSITATVFMFDACIAAMVFPLWGSVQGFTVGP